MKKRYSVQEVDSLRAVVRAKLQSGSYRGWTSFSVSFPAGGGAGKEIRDQTLEAIIEDRVRTHMVAGHISTDLIDSDPKRWNP